MKIATIDKPRSGLTTEISEIFSSNQGEGVYMGDKQIFVRFGRCNMHCVYCDELPKMQEGQYQERSLSDVLSQVKNLEKDSGPHKAVSLTGGEPLFYPKFLKVFLPEVQKRGFKIHLETNGTLPHILDNHIKYIDVIAMDLKPPSSTKDEPFWGKHREFLSIANEKEVFVKVVVSKHTTVEDILQCIDIVREVNMHIPFIIQPETVGSEVSRDAYDRIRRDFLKPAMDGLKDVRIIPQMHKLWGIK